MGRELYDFLENEFFQKMIHDKGISFALAKTIFSIILLPLPFGFLFNQCSYPEGFTRTYSQNYTILLLFLLVVCVYFFKRYMMPVINQYRSKVWRKTTAQIIEIGIFKVQVSRRFGLVIKYFPAVIYLFKVNGKDYQSNQFSFEAEYVYNFSLDDTSSNKYHKMNEIFSEWLEEKKLEIYYNPNNPKESVVFRNFHPARKIFYILIGTWATAALLVSIYNLFCYDYWMS